MWYLIDKVDVCYRITREEFEEIVAEFLQEMISPVLELNEIAKEKGLTSKRIELFGGITRIPIGISQIQTSFPSHLNEQFKNIWKKK
jgi:molecular chaperone DnaK (HSP70)